MVLNFSYVDTTSALVPSTSDIVSTFYGSGLVGLWLSLFLCGIGVSQAYHYFGQYPKDGTCIKSSIILVVLLDCFHSAIECVASYHYLVSIAEVEDTSIKLRATWTIPIAFVIHLTLACIALFTDTLQTYVIVFVRVFLSATQSIAIGQLTVNELVIDKKFQKLIIAALVLPILAHLGFGIGWSSVVTALTI
ncbi:hypothetical protein BC629DRAFT_1595009 [Irpex lacteus]|nr:hypothetical protein BC629DRAFT_1595009 [Irpex lacteus]